MSKFRQLLGRRGEKIAASFLLSRGFAMLGRNFACRRGEIDLVVREEATGQIVFVEVKTRRTTTCGGGEESLTRIKARRMWLAGLEYLQRDSDAGRRFRFDLVVVDLTSQDAEIRHYRNILGPGGAIAR